MARRKPEHGHHGGAWKVAYADFVTAMMALFIVLWILSSSQETQAAVASYFRHPRIFKSGGTGFLTEEGMVEYRSSVERIREAAQGAERGEPEAEPDAPPGPPAEPGELERSGAGDAPGTPEGAGARGAAGPHGGDQLGDSARQLERALRATPQLRALAQQVSIAFVPEGLRIQVADAEEVPLFQLGSPAPTGNAQEILTAIARVLAPLPNAILVEGHTDARPYAGQGDYTNWELSGERANAARRVLEAQGVDPRRIASVVGYADRRLLFPDDPTSPRNRRISVIIVEGTEPR